MTYDPHDANSEKNGYDGVWQPDHQTNWLYIQGEKKREEHDRQYATGGGGCFPASVKIMTPSGEVDIGAIKKGDIILSWNLASQKLVEQRVKRVIHYPPRPIVEVRFGDSREALPTTGSHSLSTRSGWTRASKITHGNELLIIARGAPVWTPVSSVASTHRVEPVINLITEGDHNYIAGGVVAHNFTILRDTRTLLHSGLEKLARTFKLAQPVAEHLVPQR